MATIKYTGARYITKFAEPINWQENTEYEQITACLYNGKSYISKRPVPANIGNPTDNPDYWLFWADPNADFEELKQNVRQFEIDVNESFEDFQEDINAEITSIRNDVNEFRSINRMRLNSAIIGHRGVNQSAPGDTLISIDLAGKWGYNFCEVDVQRTSDNVIVVHHSVNMSETSNVDMDIRENTYDDLRAIPYTKGSNVEMMPTQYLPTLKEILLKCQAYGIFPVVEVKTESFDTKEDIQLIMDIIKECGYWRKCYIMTFSEALLTFIREINPYAFLIEVRNTVNQSHIDFALQNDIDGFAVNKTGLDETLIATLRNNGFIVIGWNTESPGNTDTMLELGVDALILDDATCLNRHSNTKYFPNNYCKGGIVNGVSTVNDHEYKSALAGNFTTFIWRNPLARNEYGNFAQVARSGNNLKYCGTIPKAYKVGTVIKFKQNPYYQYAVMVCSPEAVNEADTGWIIPTDEDKFIVLSARDVVKANTVVISLTVAKKDLTDDYNSEFMFDDAAKYVEYYEPLEIQFGALNTDNIEGMNPTPQLSRVKSNKLYDVSSNKVLNLQPRDDVRIAIQGLHADGSNYTSGWITESNKGTITGYDTSNDTFTLPNTVVKIGFSWSKASGNITPKELVNCFTILKDNFAGLTLPMDKSN